MICSPQQTEQKTKFPDMIPFTRNIVTAIFLKQKAKHTDYVEQLNLVMTTDEAFIKVKLTKPPPTRMEKYQYLEEIRK